MVDPDTNHLANNIFEDITERKNTELCNKNFQDISYDSQTSSTMPKIEQAGKFVYMVETFHQWKDGSVFPVEVSTQHLSIIRDISERKQMLEQLEYIAKHDYLTNIPNRIYLEEFLRQMLADKLKKENALLIIDLDNFKIINDSYGHSEGDKVLIKVADCINKAIRNTDFAARVGGDEFAVFLSDTNLTGAQVAADKILHTLENEIYYLSEENIQVSITASIGVIIIHPDFDVKHLFSYADAALYTAKSQGKNRVYVLNNKDDKDLVKNNIFMLSQIQNALAKDKFQIYMQPIHKTGDGILHHEVLLRMLGEDNQLLYPSSFIPLAERYGLMPLIDKWVIRNTIKILSKDKALNVFINLSGTSLCNGSLLEWIELSLTSSNVKPSQIGFEITETTAIKDLEKAKVWIYKIKALGCSFALDDFGVGFSSFSYLNILPVDFLKIDGNFVRDLDSDSTKFALVKAINMLAHALGKKTIAEFVENESIWKILKELGVDYGQGYYLGRPEPLNNNIKRSDSYVMV